MQDQTTAPKFDNKSTVYIGGLDAQVNEDILYAAFIPFGEIAQVLLPKDFTTFDNHRGFGFIEFELPEDARAAIDNLHRSQLYGKTLSCSLAKASQYFSQNALSATSPIWETDEWLQQYGSAETTDKTSTLDPITSEEPDSSTITAKRTSEEDHLDKKPKDE